MPCILMGLVLVAGCGGRFSADAPMAHAEAPDGPLPAVAMMGLDYWLPLTDGAGSVAKDVTGNGHDGQIAGTGVAATWAGRVGLVLNDATMTLPKASGRATFGMCAYFPAGGSPAISGGGYSYLYGTAVGGENGYDLRSSYGPGGGVFHGPYSYFPTIGRSNGGSGTASADGFSGNHCVEAAAGATDHLVVDGVEVNYLAQGSTTDGVGGVQLNAPMYVQAGNAPQSGTAVTVYSVWGAAAADTIGQAEVRTREEIARLESLGVLFGLPVNSGTDSVCTLDGTSIDNGYKASGMPDV